MTRSQRGKCGLWFEWCGLGNSIQSGLDKRNFRIVRIEWWHSSRSNGFFGFAVHSGWKSTEYRFEGIVRVPHRGSAHYIWNFSFSDWMRTGIIHGPAWLHEGAFHLLGTWYKCSLRSIHRIEQFSQSHLQVLFLFLQQLAWLQWWQPHDAVEQFQ